ncbi:MAG: GNAT family N-acetyltransferase [Chloroflexota bacterium]
MTSSESQVIVRPARAEDRAAVLAFCLNTFSWGDYIADVWDQWLTDPNGSLLVAELSGLPVGLEQVHFVAPGEAWLQGLRVDPAVRGRGVANALFFAALDVARAAQARRARFFTAADNPITQHMAEGQGFRRLTPCRPWKADAATSPAPESAVLGDVAALWEVVSHDENFALAGNTYCLGWQALNLTPELLAVHVAAGEVRLLRRLARPAALAICRQQRFRDEPRLWLSGIWGEAQATGVLAEQLRGLALEMSLTGLDVLAPDSPLLAATLARAGYYQENPTSPGLLLYELDLAAT